MSYESSRSMGRAATLLIVLTTVTTPIIAVGAFFLGLLQNLLLFTVLYSALSYAGQVLFLVAMNRFADYYRDRAIFRNALYGFITAVVGSVVFIILTFGAFSSLRGLLPTTPATPSTPPSMSILVAFISFFLIIWLGAFIIALVQSLFYRRAFYALADKSGESNFRQAGLFMLIGGVLTIIFVGALIFFVGWIFAVLGFFHMQPGASQAYSPQTPSSMGRVRYCPTCGKENSESDAFCSRCGSRLWRG